MRSITLIIEHTYENDQLAIHKLMQHAHFMNICTLKVGQAQYLNTKEGEMTIRRTESQ